MYKIHPKTLFIGQNSYYLPSCQSTNDEAADLLARSNPPEGTLIVTDNQTAGRGQRGNSWQAEPGQNLTYSTLLRPLFLAPTEQFWLNIAISVGIADALDPLTEGLLRVKWPNDLYINNQKTGGILIENTIQGSTLAWSVIGFGLNVNQTMFPIATATSLQSQFPLPDGYHLPGLLTLLCEHIEKRYLQLKAGHRAVLKASYLQRLFRYEQEGAFCDTRTNQTFVGRLTGVDESGQLMIDVDGQQRLFSFKEIQFLLD
ncbi:MAG: biotin--[acetyl-CoA-carboxylase] ligase [Cytophagales bacterium]|nr:MAG: biotin--[acetyl-CoA-carboxylase] ligase [Cytophagales bacterium]